LDFVVNELYKEEREVKENKVGPVHTKGAYG
jgi:hypothetical protein